MIIRFSCILFLAISGVSFSDAQRAFAGGFDGADFLNVNNGGNEPTLRGFDPNMRIPRFQNRRLGELPRPLQIEVINALIANGVRGSRVNNGFTAGVGGANNAAINTRRFTINGAQGRTFGVDTLTATGMNGGGVAGRRFTVNNRFGDSLSTTRIGRIPPPGNGGQTIDLAATRATGRIGGRPAVRTTTRITGGMPRSGILGGLGGNVDDLFLDPVSGRRVLVRPIGVANNLVNQRTNGDGGIGGGFTDPAGGNGFRRLPTSTFAGGPQTNLRRSQLPIFPPGGMAGTIRNTNFNRGVPNDRVSPFPFSGMQTDMISNNVAPQPIALSSLEPFSENFMARQQFNFPPPGFDAGRPRVPPARPPPGLGSLPGPESPPVPGITFPRQPPVDVNPSTTSGTSDFSNSLTFDSVNPALFSSGPDTTTVDSDIRSIALPRATIDRIPITPTVRRGSRININLRPLRPAGGTAGAISSMSRSRGFNVDGNVDIDIGVPTSINRGQGGIGIDIPDTRATIDMTSRVPATSSRMETTRTTTRFTGDSTGVAGSRIDPIDNTIDNTIDRSGVGLDASAASVKTTSIKKIGVDGVTDVGTSGSVTRTTTTTTTRRLAEAGITGDSALSIEKQLNAIEQQLVAAAGVDRPVFAVIPMNEKANQADFNEFLRNMTNANQVNIINRKSTTSTNTVNTIGGGVDNSMGGMMTVDGNMGNGGAVDGSSSSFSSSFESSSSSTRTSSTTTSGDTSMAGNAGAGTGGITKIKKTTIFRRTSPTGNVGTADVGFDGFGADVGGSMSTSFVNDGGMSTSFVNDGVTGGFTTGGMASAGTMSDGSGIIDTGLVDPGPVDMGVSGSFTNGAFPTDLPPMNDVTAMPDPMPL
ncbi:nuclear pore complex protein DDB_G0274915-like [Saccostrea cucullata]|uniref:nuclear pore complex protein DDB_G0274915-like n=1 Tax=Saccostrea cuccullata TaxID=36930 RepID=UPI002ED18944